MSAAAVTLRYLTIPLPIEKRTQEGKYQRIGLGALVTRSDVGGFFIKIIGSSGLPKDCYRICGLQPVPFQYAIDPNRDLKGIFVRIDEVSALALLPHKTACIAR